MSVSRIPLTQGFYTLLDTADARRLSHYRWHVSRAGKTMYARTGAKEIGRNMQLMHRLLLKAQPGQIVDHRNGNGLDNRRCNLRLATNRQNAHNAFVITKEDGKSSRYKGVHGFDGAWLAVIKVEGEQRRLGIFPHEVQAALAYDAAAGRFFGQYARTNAMMGLLPGQQEVDRNAGLDRGLIFDRPHKHPPLRRHRKPNRQQDFIRTTTRSRPVLSLPSRFD